MKTILFFFAILLQLFNQEAFSQIEQNFLNVPDTCIIIQPGGENGVDAFLHQLDPNTNYGTYSDFISFDWTFGGQEALGYSLIKFDLSMIPTNAIITEAKLSLYHNPSSSGAAGQAGDNACYLKKVLSNWTENLVTWNTMPSTSTAGQIFLPTSSLTTQNYPDINVLPMVSYWHSNPNQNFGLMLEIINKNLYNSMKFCSSDYPIDSMRPKLKICFKLTSNSNELLLKKEIPFSLFPNPSKDKISILLQDDYHFNQIEIINSNGQIVYKIIEDITFNNSYTIDISNLEIGVYSIRLKNSTSSFEKLFIIE